MLDAVSKFTHHKVIDGYSCTQDKLHKKMDKISIGNARMPWAPTSILYGIARLFNFAS